jgi:hypothetical protein
MCKNMFLEPDGFCSMCGKNHFDQRDKTSMAARRKKGKSVTVIQPTLWGTKGTTIFPQPKPVAPKTVRLEEDYFTVQARKAEIRKVVLDVAETYGIPKNRVRIEFRSSRRGSYHQKQNDGSHKLVFGRNMNTFAESGYREYRSIDWMVPKPRPTGLQAARWLALHEAAHMIVSHRGQRYYGDQHGRIFQTVYQELQEMCL